MIEVLKQALEALYPISHNSTDDYRGQADKAITSLRQAIAELESQEPVSALWQHGETGRFRVTAPDSITDCDARWFKVGDLYLRPPQRTEQEPVAYINVEMRRLEFAHDYVKWDTPTTIKLDKIPLYTHLPQRTWVGLTDEEIKKTAKKHRWHESNVAPHLIPVFRSLESKLKEKNT